MGREYGFEEAAMSLESSPGSVLADRTSYDLFPRTSSNLSVRFLPAVMMRYRDMGLDSGLPSIDVA